MKMSEYKALPDASEGMSEGDLICTDSLRSTNLLLAGRDEHKKGDTVTFLEVSRVVNGVIVNYDVRREELT